MKIPNFLIAKLYLLSMIILMYACDQSASNNDLIKNDSLIKAGSYPSIIDSLGVQKLYDKTKWTLYCIYSDDSCILKENLVTGEVKTFGSLELKFKKIKLMRDTIEIYFDFYYNDIVRCDINSLKDYKHLATGMGYKTGSDSILYYISSSTLQYFWEKGPGSRYENPLQPDVLRFIQTNNEKLNPWFREAARQRRII